MHSLKEGLKTPAADVEPRDDQLLLWEWLDYPTSRVPQMQPETIEQGANEVSSGQESSIAAK